MTSARASSLDEGYAERYALESGDRLFASYVSAFRDPRIAR
jgi:hypothetical protein